MLRLMLPAVLGLILTAAGARADAPKPGAVDLDDLRYAVTVAETRGHNVGMIAEALATFEKALAKNTSAKPGEAPAELTALREAVEVAAKKGENVEAISKELSLLEKTLTGRAYERPRLPEPKLDPVPPLRRGGVIIGGGMGRGRVVIGGAEGFNFNSVTITNNTFVLKARQNDVTYTITGTLDGNDPPKIVIQAGENKIEADNVKNVPEKYRDHVEKMLKSVKR